MCFNHLICVWNNLAPASLAVLSFSTIGAGFEGASEGALNNTATPEDVVPAHIAKSTIGWMVGAFILFLMVVGIMLYIGRRQCRGCRRSINKTRETLGQWPHDLRLFAGVVPRLNNIADGDIAPVIARALAPVEEISGGDLELGNMKDDGRERAIVPDIVSGSDG